MFEPSTQPLTDTPGDAELTKTVPSEAELQEMVELLDEVGLDFALHQHHPLSYLEGEAV